MATVKKFSSIPLSKGGKAYISVGNFDTQFESGPLLLTSLSEVADRFSVTLDAPIGSPVNYESIGFKVLPGHTLNTLGGDDSLDVLQGAAAGAIGIKVCLGGKLDMGAGKDQFGIILSGTGSIGIDNQGKLLTGGGIELLKAEGELNGIVNGSPSNAAALFDTGALGDKLEGISTSGHGIVNYGVISMGSAGENDSDKLIGSSAGHPVLPPPPSYTPGQFGIFNAGVINMGGGGDAIDALVGGFGGGGTYNLGWSNGARQDQDNDSVSGFGWGTFDGGGGRNGITLPEGTYWITYTGVRPATVRDPASGFIVRSSDVAGTNLDTNPGTTDVTQMTFKGFDGIGGSGLNAGLHFVDVNPITGVASVLESLTVNAAGQIASAQYVA